MTPTEMYVVVDNKNQVVAASPQAVVRKDGVSCAMLPGRNQRLYKLRNVDEHVFSIQHGDKFHAEINRIYSEHSGGKKKAKGDLVEIDTSDIAKYIASLKSSHKK